MVIFPGEAFFVNVNPKLWTEDPRESTKVFIVNFANATVVPAHQTVFVIKVGGQTKSAAAVRKQLTWIDQLLLTSLVVAT